MPNTVTIVVTVDNQTGPGLAAATASVAAASRAASGAGGGFRDLNIAMNLASGGAANAGGRFGILRKSIALFGGAAGTGAMLGAVTGFHLLADAIIETAAVVGPAVIAFGAFAAAAVPTIQDIVQQEQNMHTVSQALGKQMPGLSGGFKQVADAVKPQVYSLMGEALGVINQKTGTFRTLATGAGTVLDQLGARAELALGGKGLNGLILAGVQDLRILGNIGGNILGTLGNLLKTMPGYAEKLFMGIENVTSALEKVTGSGFTQGLIHMGLSFHGLLLYSGLAATAIWSLRVPLTRLGSLLVTAGLNILSFGQNIFKAQGAAGKLGTAFGFLTRIPVWGWVAIGAAALTGLYVLLSHVKDATQRWTDSLDQNINAQITIPSTILATAAALAEVHTRMQNILDITKPMGVQGRDLAGTYLELKDKSVQLSGQFHGQETRQAELIKNFGSLTHAMGLAGLMNINLVKDFKAGGSVFQQDQTAMEGYTRAVVQMAGFTGGRAAAAQNALTNATDAQVTALQQVAQAQDFVINTIVGGRQAFIAFEQDLQQMTKDAKNAKGGVDGLGANSLQLGKDFYTTTIPAAQALIDKLNAQHVSTKNLTTAVADEVKQMIPFTKGSTDAKAVLVSLINNALGPGTVNLKDLNKWVEKNSGSLKGFNSIIATSAIKAGSLSNVLQNDLNVQFHQALLKESGASGALQQYTRDILHNQTQTAQGKSDRQRLINDLINSGLSAKQARKFVDGLQTSVNGLHGKNIGIGVTASGKGGISIFSSQGGSGQKNVWRLILQGMAKGGKLPGFGGGDQLPYLLEPGEAVVDKHRTRRYASTLKAMGVPGMASGGIAGMEPFAAGALSTDTGNDMFNWVKSVIAQVKRMAQQAIGGVGGPGGGAPAANAALAHRLYASQLSPADWAAWNAVAMAESGWNQFATNPTSGAYGIPQAFPPTKMPFAAQAAGGSNPMAQITWMWQYMKSVYGGPLGAEASELNRGWYDHGGWLPKGRSIAYNNTGAPERIIGPNEAITLEVTGGDSEFGRFMENWMKKFVRVRGGGDVQAAFGRH